MVSKVEVRSYIQAGDTFVPIAQFNGPLEDRNYVEGALELIIDGKTVSDISYNDLIDQFWAYIIGCLEKVVAGERGETFWPDQPIKLAFSPIPANKVLVERSGSSDPDVRVVVDTFDLVDALLAGASEFFRVYLPLSDWNPADVLEPLERLENWRLQSLTVPPYG